jgi:RNA polymerase sigma-70 factor (ECF subfamily)
MLGSVADAEDAVQETYLRWHAADRSNVLDARAFLMTTTTRICLSMLTSARARREEYIGPWLPEPVVDHRSVRARQPHGEREAGRVGHATVSGDPRLAANDVARVSRASYRRPAWAARMTHRHHGTLSMVTVVAASITHGQWM